MKGWRYLGLAAVAGSSIATASQAAEQLNLTACYSGRFSVFQNSKKAMLLSNWAESGIFMSNGQKKPLNGAVFHCEGVQRGIGAQRSGYGLCKIVDQDGALIIAGGPYSGLIGRAPILEGTGKWKGITGTISYKRIVRSKPLRGAMPLTYQGCQRWRGSFNLSK